MKIILSIFLLITLLNMIISFFIKRDNILYCGMVGFSGSTNFNPDKIAQLLLANMTRGVHSTGMYNNGVISKMAEDAIYFLAENRIIPGNTFMGHDRHATIGSKTAINNAHPFRYGTIIGQHNGTLKNHWNLCRDNDLTYSDYDVDSQVLIELISKDKEDLEVLQEFEGAAAIIWHDEDHPNRLYCFRNSERPLYRGMIDEGMYISSIEASLKMIGCEKIQQFKENFVYSIENGQIILESSKRVVKKDYYNKKKPRHQYDKSPQGFGSGYNTGSDNNDKGISLEKINVMCHWVRCIKEDPKSKWQLGDWANVISESGEQLILKFSENVTITSRKDIFSPYEKLNVNGYIRTVHGDGKYFEKGDFLLLRGLELSENKKKTNAVIEKLEEDDSSYTWGSSNVRNATQEEIDEFMFAKSVLLKPETEKVSELEEKMFLFENNKQHIDLDGNKLGSLWVEVGSSYETLIKVRDELERLSSESQGIVDGNVMIPSVRDAINELNTSLSELYDISENEIENMFEKLFDLYKV